MKNLFNIKIKLLFLFVVLLFGSSSAQERVRLDFNVSISALKFIEKWIPGQKLLVNVILPAISLQRTMDIVRLNKMISKEFVTKHYFLFDFNLKAKKYDATGISEIYWFPFESHLYNKKMHCSELIAPNVTQLKHILFYSGTKPRHNDLNKFCILGFDSNVVHYFKEHKTNTTNHLIFEEIFKIDGHNEILKSNILAKVNQDSHEMQISGLNSYIWERRNNLDAANFDSLVDVGPPYIIDTKMIKNENGEYVLHPVGYNADLMQHLMSKLNFTLKHTLAKMRNDYKFMLNAITKGHYDIGLSGFSLKRGRRDLVDFSFGLSSLSLSLYYIKSYRKLNFHVFMESFQSEAWYAMTIFVCTIIFGYVCLSWMMKERKEASSIGQIFDYLKKAVNFALRSIIGKRMSSEPDWISTKTAFFILTLVGFIFITLYRAMLVAFVAVEIQTPPVNSLGEILSSDYRLAIPKNTGSDDIFLHAKPESDEEKLNNSDKILRFQGGVLEFMDQMTSDENPYGNVILLHVHESVKTLAHYPCKIKKVPNYYYKKNIAGMIFKKNWPFTRLLNYHLLIMKEKGIMNRYFQPYEKTTDETCKNEIRIRSTLNVVDPVSLYTTVVLFLVISGGLLCSLGVFVVELIAKARCVEM